VTVQITRIEAAVPDRPGTPILLARFDVDIPDVATLRNCLLLESKGGFYFIKIPDALKFRSCGSELRDNIADAALDAFEAIKN
jgi:hypothetical protein